MIDTVDISMLAHISTYVTFSTFQVLPMQPRELHWRHGALEPTTAPGTLTRMCDPSRGSMAKYHVSLMLETCPGLRKIAEVGHPGSHSTFNFGDEDIAKWPERWCQWVLVRILSSEKGRMGKA
jgi:hypothetical protein